MVTTAALAKSLLWMNTSRVIQATPYPSGPKLQLSLLVATLASINHNALTMFNLTLIGFTQMKHPLCIKLQEWVNINLIEPSMKISCIQML